MRLATCLTATLLVLSVGCATARGVPSPTDAAHAERSTASARAMRDAQPRDITAGARAQPVDAAGLPRG